jgi:hypothetical protein
LLRTDFDIGAEHKLDIAFKLLEEDTAYIFNNDSYHFVPTLKNPAFALGPGTYLVRVRLRGIHVDEVFEFSFINPGAGAQLVVTPSDARTV